MKVLLFAVLIALVAPVQAQHKILDMNPPKAKAPMKRQVERMGPIRAHKLKGYIGESDDGMLAIRESTGLSAAQVKRMKTLVEEENKDRKIIYDEIAKHNKLSDKEKTMLIQSAYETYRNTDAKGIYYREKNVWHKRF